MTDQALVADLLRLARKKSLHITIAESCTGGLLAAAITEIAGASDVFSRGYVTYSNSAKMDMLGVKLATLNTHGAVSEEVASEMALGALAGDRADIAIAVTGIAGPGSSDNKPEGRVCFALAGRNRPVYGETTEFGALGRETVRARSVLHALNMLVAAVS